MDLSLRGMNQEMTARRGDCRVTASLSVPGVPRAGADADDNTCERAAPVSTSAASDALGSEGARERPPVALSPLTGTTGLLLRLALSRPAPGRAALEGAAMWTATCTAAGVAAGGAPAAVPAPDTYKVGALTGTGTSTAAGGAPPAAPAASPITAASSASDDDACRQRPPGGGPPGDSDTRGPWPWPWPWPCPAPDAADTVSAGCAAGDGPNTGPPPTTGPALPTSTGLEADGAGSAGWPVPLGLAGAAAPVAPTPPRALNALANCRVRSTSSRMVRSRSTAATRGDAVSSSLAVGRLPAAAAAAGKGTSLPAPPPLSSTPMRTLPRFCDRGVPTPRPLPSPWKPSPPATGAALPALDDTSSGEACAGAGVVGAVAAAGGMGLPLDPPPPLLYRSRRSCDSRCSTASSSSWAFRSVISREWRVRLLDMREASSSVGVASAPGAWAAACWKGSPLQRASIWGISIP
jgi:hypothetical protein